MDVGDCNNSVAGIVMNFSTDLADTKYFFLYLGSFTRVFYSFFVFCQTGINLCHQVGRMKNFLSFGAIVVFVLFIGGCSKTSGNLIDAGSMTATLAGSS